MNLKIASRILVGRTEWTGLHGWDVSQGSSTRTRCPNSEARPVATNNHPAWNSAWQRHSGLHPNGRYDQPQVDLTNTSTTPTSVAVSRELGISDAIQVAIFQDGLGTRQPRKVTALDATQDSNGRWDPDGPYDDRTIAESTTPPAHDPTRNERAAEGTYDQRHASRRTKVGPHLGS